MRAYILLVLLVYGISWCKAYETDSEFDYGTSIIQNNKKLGFGFCILEYYEDSGAPKEIIDAYKAFFHGGYILQEDVIKMRNWIRGNIDRYIPVFHPESSKNYDKYQPWYFVACLNMYNSKEYEDMINDLK